MIRNANGEVKGAILVVEDDRAIRRILCEQLESLGYLSFEYPDERSVMAELGELGRISYSMAFVDLSHSRDGDGGSVVRELRRRHPDKPVVVMSGRAVNNGGAGGYWTSPKMVCESSGTLSKPFRLQDLREAIEDNLGGPWRGN